jgi:hypothetical protein
MPRYQHNPTGVPTGLPEQLSEGKSRIQSPATNSAAAYGTIGRKPEAR